MKRLQLQDNEYRFDGFTHKRVIVRAFVIDESGNVALHRIFRDDQFGRQGYYETPGGGVDDGETLLEALIRECKEELGLVVKPIEEIGVVEDAYNLIGRQNENHFYVASIAGKAEKHLVSDGDKLIQETVWVPLHKAKEIYENMSDRGVSGLVKARELPMLLEAMQYINKKNL